MTVYRRPDPVPRSSRPQEFQSTLAPLREQNTDLNQLAAKHIFMAIISKQWGASGNLPKEDELGNQLKVSRTVVREATRYLAAKSMVKTRRRRGTSILDLQFWNLIDREVIDWMVESRQFPELEQDLLDALALSQPALAELAAERPTAAAELSETAARIATLPAAELPDLILSFHEQIAIAAGNPFMRSLTANVTEGMRRHHFEAVRRFASRCRAEDYRNTVAAIRDGDGATAKETMAAIFGRIQVVV